MVSGFDLAATEYDSSFTHTAVGMLQRTRVYSYLRPYLKQNKGMHILEINCGTGEDALYMAEMGHSVLATDLSQNMIARGRSKVGHLENISFRQLDINGLDGLSLGKKADILFSNFGGLNCISPDEFCHFLKTAAEKLANNGLIIAVIMTKNCLWDRLYSLLKGKPAKANRRSSGQVVNVPVEGKMVQTWYYNPEEIEHIAQNNYSRILVKPIGFLIPPSYLNAYFGNKKTLLSVLAWLDRKLFRMSYLSKYADHFIIVLQRK